MPTKFTLAIQESRVFRGKLENDAFTRRGALFVQPFGFPWRRHGQQTLVVGVVVGGGIKGGRWKKGNAGKKEIIPD